MNPFEQMNYKTKTSISCFLHRSKKKAKRGNGFHESEFRIEPFRPRTILRDDNCTINAQVFKTNLYTIMTEIGIVVSFDKDYNDVWHFEFGTKPAEKTIYPYDRKMIQIANMKKWAAMQVAVNRLEKCEYLRDNDDDYNPNDGFYGMPVKWIQGMLSISYEKNETCIVIDYNHFDGNKETLYVIIRKIEDGLKQIGHEILKDDWNNRLKSQKKEENFIINITTGEKKVIN
jgi:hypothetical protein